jgi:gamma-glutamyltranspeptidase/glutathione hydrolase
MRRRIGVAASAWLVGVAIGAPALRAMERRAIAEPPAKGAPTVYTRGVVAADEETASRAGAEMLRRGGNAVDAAVAASLTLSVVRPFACGIGGGGFMVVDLPAVGPKHVAVRVAINYRETAPGAVGPDYYEKQEDALASTRGAAAVGVPGTVAGLMWALEKYGTLDRAAVCGPAIRAAHEGFAADANYASNARDAAKDFETHPEWKTRFAFVWETLLERGQVKAGDRIANEGQARALERIRDEGAAGFYGGEVAQAIVESSARDGGVLTGADLAGYRVQEVEPLEFTFAGRRFLTMPPPSSGGVAMGEALGILERRDLAGMVKQERWAEYTHALVEAFKHAFADRAEWLGDPAFVPGGVPVERLLSDEYLKARAERVQVRQTHGPEWYGTRDEAGQPKDDGGTSHLCAVDKWGGAVACTETINLEFGSMVAVEGYGFCLNDEMDDFTTRRGQANAFGLKQSDKNLPAPGKRPLSSMSPTIVLDAKGNVEAVAGGAGGPRIITATTQVLLDVLVLGQGAEEAVGRSRLHHQWEPNVLEFEKGYDQRWQGLAVPMWMRKFRHEVKEKERGGAVVQLIVRAKGGKGWEAACDPRKGGKAAGE